MHTGTLADYVFGDWAMLPVALLYLYVGVELLRHASRAVALALQNCWKGHRWNDTVFRPIGDATLPKHVGEFFNRHTDDLLELGFQQLAQYRERGIAGSGYVRVFRSADGNVLADIFYQQGSKGLGFFSLFDDGFYLGVATAHVGDDSHVTVSNAADTPSMQFWMVFGASVRRVFECYGHRRAACEEERNASVRLLATDDPPSLLNRIRRLVASQSVGRWRLDPPLPARGKSISATAGP